MKKFINKSDKYLMFALKKFWKSYKQPFNKCQKNISTIENVKKFPIIRKILFFKRRK